MKNIIWLFFLSFNCLGSSNFIDLNTGYSLTIDSESKRYRMIDEQAPAEFCPDDSAYICMQSIHINYAIPKRRSLPKSWEFSGKTYCRVDIFDYKLSDKQV